MKKNMDKESTYAENSNQFRLSQISNPQAETKTSP